MEHGWCHSRPPLGPNRTHEPVAGGGSLASRRSALRLRCSLVYVTRWNSYALSVSVPAGGMERISA